MRNLMNELDKIYEQVYGLNENLSARDLQLLQEGFEDGIKEGFFGNMKKKINNVADKVGKGVGNVLNKADNIKQGVKDKYNDAKKGVSTAYNKGKELANQAWTNVNDYISATKTKIENGFSDAKQYMFSKYSEYKQKTTELYTKTINDISSKYEELKDKAEEFAKAITGSINTLIANIKAQGDAMVKKYNDDQEAFKKYVSENYNELKDSAQQSAKSGIETIKKLGTKALEYLTSFGKKTLKITGEVIVVIVFGSIMGLSYIAKSLWNGGKDLYEKGKVAVNKAIADWNEQGPIANSYRAGKESVRENNNMRFLKTYKNFNS